MNGRGAGCSGRSLLALVVLVIFSTTAHAMGDNVIGQVFDQIQQKFSDGWNAIFDPIYVWYFWGGVFFLGAIAAAVFLQFKWIRAALGIAVLLVAAYIAGGRHMSQNMREKLADEQRKRKEAEAAARQRNDGSSTQAGGGWFGTNW